MFKTSWADTLGWGWVKPNDEKICSYDFDLDYSTINTETCWNGSKPQVGNLCPIDRARTQTCEIDDDFKVEIRDMSRPKQ